MKIILYARYCQFNNSEDPSMLTIQGCDVYLKVRTHLGGDSKNFLKFSLYTSF